jgi:NADPH-dependent glutamate synthase beta subunit-like oxidoreductase
VNPCTGFEAKLPAAPALATRRRRVAVVGAGPAGITAALAAAARGHGVTLFEAGERAGGWLRAGAVPAIKFDVANYLAHLEHRLERAERDGLEFRRASAATAEGLRAEGFDAILCCTGSAPATPAMADPGGLRTALAVEVLLDPGLVAEARRVVVVGGGDVGCETAHMLAFELGREVTVVEQGDNFMAASCTANRGYLLRALAGQGVRLVPAARVVALRPGAIELLANRSDTVPDPAAVWRPVLPRNIHNPFARAPVLREERLVVDADMAVFATGGTPRQALHQACIALRAAPDIRLLGDAFRVGRILDATRAGHAAGMSL